MPETLVRQTGNGDLGNRWVQRQHAFDFSRRDVLAAGNDHIVNPAGDEEIAVSVDKAGIPGEVPALAQCPGVGIGPPPIALESLVTDEIGDHFTFLTNLRKRVW